MQTFEKVTDRTGPHRDYKDLMRRPVAKATEESGTPSLGQVEPKIVLRDVNFFYGAAQALFKVNIDVAPNHVTAFIGPSGCGKSTLLRCLNRLNDLIEGARLEGRILLDA